MSTEPGQLHIGVDELNVGTDQGGRDGEGIEVVIDWEPGAETSAVHECPAVYGHPTVHGEHDVPIQSGSQGIIWGWPTAGTHVHAVAS